MAKLFSEVVEEWRTFLNADNPNKVTAEQADTYTVDEVDDKVDNKCKGRLIPILYFQRSGNLPAATYTATTIDIAEGVGIYNGFEKPIPAVSVPLGQDMGIYMVVNPDMTYAYFLGTIDSSKYWNYVKIGTWTQATMTLKLVRATKVGTTIIASA